MITWGRLVEDLSKNGTAASPKAHLDPDLNPASIRRAPDWRGTFGQSSSQQSYLDKNHVEAGDLFFGLYRRVERTGQGKLQFVKGTRYYELAKQLLGISMGHSLGTIRWAEPLVVGFNHGRADTRRLWSRHALPRSK